MQSRNGCREGKQVLPGIFRTHQPHTVEPIYTEKSQMESPGLGQFSGQSDRHRR
jgi:hypothetical protein